MDIDRIRADNEAQVGVKRKQGLIIWTGDNPTKEMKLRWQRESREKYGLTVEQVSWLAAAPVVPCVGC